MTAAPAKTTASPAGTGSTQVAKTPPRPIQPAPAATTSPGGPTRVKIINGVNPRPGMAVAGTKSLRFLLKN